MSQHFFREIENLKKKLLTLGAVVEERIAKALAAVVKHDMKLALEVVEGDTEIDLMEVDVEEDCLKLLALYQPVAIDLRFVVAVLKINTDLERMADHAVNIARRAEYLATYPNAELPAELEIMLQKAQTMVRDSLDAFVRQDPMLARRVCTADREVDQLNRQMHVLIQQQIRADPERVEQFIHQLSVSRQLERVADLATNIAEDVVYTVEGEIIRHRTAVYS